ncbi:MAG: AAA family ATPase [Sulfuritalea sp.]|nr:AAA family ATPase [Sulfuritalea sp.]
MIVFVGGIHGVGKTYLGAPAAKHLGIRHATASQLIREERGLQTWGADKRVAGIDENQAALVSATTRLRTDGQRLLLDGHFVLREANGSFAKVDVQVFRDLQIGAVLLLATDLDVVLNRLHERGDHSWSESELRTFADHEEIHARRISAELCLPLRRLVSATHEEFLSALRVALSL